MSQLATRNKGVNRQFEPKINQGRARGQARNYYNNQGYTQWSYQDRYRSSSVETEEINIDRIGVGQNMDQIIGEKTLEIM